jgi:membrane-associated phospholipid phosphatase
MSFTLRSPLAAEPVSAPAKPRPARAAARAFFRLRPEEAIALVVLLPTTYLSITAATYAREAGVLGARLPGGLVRLAVAVLLLAALALAWRRRPTSRVVATLRDVVPFVACILIYTNLHDTIGFVNGNDVHFFLDALDRELLGVQPTVWAERFITPARTELMQLLYLNFFWIAPSMSLLLLWQKRRADFRAVTLGVIVCFYLGYLLYVVFPAAPPRLVLVYEFKRSLAGHPSLFSNLSARAFGLLPADSRAAFPSLHAAVSLVVLIYAWRHLRVWFWIALPFVLGLWTSTIYLRHHYTVDVLAGWALAPVAVAAAPRLDAWWNARRRALGLPPVAGEP